MKIAIKVLVMVMTCGYVSVWCADNQKHTIFLLQAPIVHDDDLRSEEYADDSDSNLATSGSNDDSDSDTEVLVPVKDAPLYLALKPLVPLLEKVNAFVHMQEQYSDGVSQQQLAKYDLASARCHWHAFADQTKKAINLSENALDRLKTLHNKQCALYPHPRLGAGCSKGTKSPGDQMSNLEGILDAQLSLWNLNFTNLNNSINQLRQEVQGLADKKKEKYSIMKAIDKKVYTVNSTDIAAPALQDVDQIIATRQLLQRQSDNLSSEKHKS